MPTKKTPTKYKKLKGWAVLCSASKHISAYTNKERAIERREWLDAGCGLKHKLVPAIITYSVPTKIER